MFKEMQIQKTNEVDHYEAKYSSSTSSLNNFQIEIFNKFNKGSEW